VNDIDPTNHHRPTFNSFTKTTQAIIMVASSFTGQRALQQEHELFSNNNSNNHHANVNISTANSNSNSNSNNNQTIPQSPRSSSVSSPHNNLQQLSEYELPHHMVVSHRKSSVNSPNRSNSSSSGSQQQQQQQQPNQDEKGIVVFKVTKVRETMGSGYSVLYH
jgi:hypothetical protein